MKNRSSRLLLENILANYAYVIMMGVVTLVATPIYVHRLGASQWGIVALCMTFQGMLLILDAGLGQVMPREIARAARTGHAVPAYFASLKIYGSIAVAAFLSGQLLAGFLGGQLSRLNASLQPDLVIAFRLVLLQFLFQFPNNAAIAYWNGNERQGLANMRLAVFTFSKHTCSVLLVTYWQHSAVAYMIPFAILGAVEFFANLRRIGADATGNPDARSSGAPSVGGLIASAGGFSVAVVIGMLTSQIDRLFLSRVVSAELFGKYVLAANLGLTLMHLQGPIQRAFLPRIVAIEDPSPRVISQMLGLFAVVCLLPCIVLAGVAEPLLRFWMKSAEFARVGAPVFQLIAVAVGINGLYGAIYILLIRDNQYKLLIVLNVVILLSQLAMLNLLSGQLSILAGGFSRLLGSCIQLLFGVAVLSKLYLSHEVRYHGSV